MKEYVLAILKDHRGDPSSSRWIAFLAFATLVGLIWIGVGSDPKQHKLIIDMANALIWLIIGCVMAGQGASAASSLSEAKAGTITSLSPGTPTPGALSVPNAPTPSAPIVAPTPIATEPTTPAKA